MGLVVNQDNTESILKLLQSAYTRGLEAIGLQAEGYAKGLARHDTGFMAAHITHKVEGKSVYIGVRNCDYAIYNEFGTGEYAENGGRKGGWFYVDAKGVGHFTMGMKPKPFLRPAAKEHGKEYRSILEHELYNG